MQCQDLIINKQTNVNNSGTFTNQFCIVLLSEHCSQMLTQYSGVS